MPAAVVTRTSTVPVPAGAVAVIDVAVSSVTVALVAPNFTLVSPERLTPSMVTVVPPAVGPLDGVTEVTAGPLVAV